MQSKIKLTSSALARGDEICSGGNNSLPVKHFMVKLLKLRASQTLDSDL